jgi:hypothetical protein
MIVGCQKARSSIIVPEQPKTMLRVTNGEFLDAVVYVVNRGQRVRLGVANANRTTRFEIPKQLVFGATPLSFLVDPIGGNTRPSTGDMVIDPGDDLELRLNGGRLLLTKR